MPQLVLVAHIFYRRPGLGGTSEAFNQAPVEATEFTVPPDFHEMKMPDIGGALGGKKDESATTTEPS